MMKPTPHFVATMLEVSASVRFLTVFVIAPRMRPEKNDKNHSNHTKTALFNLPLRKFSFLQFKNPQQQLQHQQQKNPFCWFFYFRDFLPDPEAALGAGKLAN